MTNGGKKVVKVLCIYYLVGFQEEQVKALLDSNSKINIINRSYAKKLGFKVQITNIGAQKMDSSALVTFGLVIPNFQVEDKVDRPRFFQKIFVVADTKFEVILRMLFLKLSNVNMSFGKKTLTWKICITNKALSTNKQV